MITKTAIIPRLAEARERGADYIVAHQREDGAIGAPERQGAGPYYKALWALSSAGRTDAANRLASWVARDLQTAEGDFAGPNRGELMNHAYSYMNAWIIAGAQKLERYDVTARGMDFLLRMQQPEGGFRTQREGDAQDVLCSAQSGNACLLTGNLKPAIDVGRFLQRVWQLQPRPQAEQFFFFKPGSGLRTEFPEERQKLFSIRTDTPRQAYFNAGIAAAFLARLSMATGDAGWADLGGQYIEITRHCLDEMYETAQVGKVGWGAALLYAATGDEQHRALAERVGEAMIAQQHESGGWDNTGGYVNDAIRAEVTCEFVMLLDEMIAGLSSR